MQRTNFGEMACSIARTLDVIGENGRATDHLLNLLRKAIGSSEGVEIRWQRR